MTILNALLLTGTLAGGAGAPAPSLGPSSWVLTGFSGPRSFQTVRGDAPTLTLKGGTVSGNAGCNLYNGSLTVSGPRFKVGPLTTTRKLCDPITMRVENDYLRVLGAATSYRLSAQTQMSAQTLTLYAGKAGRLTFRAGGSAMTPPNRPAPKPSPTSPVPQPAQLLAALAREWQASELVLHGKTVNLPSDAALKFNQWGEKLQLSGQLGCNRLMGEATLNGTALTFAPVGMTRMMCEDMVAEGAFAELVRQPVQAIYSGSTLTLQNAAGRLKLERLEAAMTDTAQLQGRNFTLVSIGGQVVKTERPVTLKFSAGNRLGGNDGCNGYGGEYKFGKGGELLLTSPLTSTMMACPGETPGLPGMLAEQPRLTLSGKTLTLTVGGAEWVFAEE